MNCFELVKEFDTNIPGIVVTQHIPPKFSEMFAERIDRQCRCTCKEAKTGDEVKPGQILIAPGDKQMRLVKVGNKYQVECRGEERVNGHCPSVDVLFESIAEIFQNRALGVIMTGMGKDGAVELAEMRKQGAWTLGQDEKSAIVYGMPKAAFERGLSDIQCDIRDMASIIVKELGVL